VQMRIGRLKMKSRDKTRIFGGDYSRAMWKAINEAKTKKDLQSALYLVCCRLQEFEDRLITAREQSPQEEMAKRMNQRELDEYVNTLEKLLQARQRLLDEIPPCPVHGKDCIPHAIEWVQKKRGTLFR
jgi:hypothetical protein